MPMGPPYYLMPSSKWLPVYYPPESWQVRDNTFPMEAPKPPPGKAVYWWLQPKETWPYPDEMPWESKQLGCWPSSKITMSDDLFGIWPGPRRAPKFGYIKLKMPGEPGRSFNDIPFTNFRIYTRWISPDEMKVMTMITPFGPRCYMRSQNWAYKEYEYSEFKAGLKARRRAQIEGLLAESIANGTKGEPKPTKDLFV